MHSHVDIAVLVSRSSSPSTLPEMGFVCAQRHRVPTIAIDPVLAADELWHIETETSPARQRLEAEDADAVQHRLGPDNTVRVRRSPGRVVVTVDHRGQTLGPKEQLRIADLARQAIRDHDPYVAVIDIVVPGSAQTDAIGNIKETS